MAIFMKLMNINFFDFDKWVLQMLYYDRTDLSEGVDPANRKECIV